MVDADLGVAAACGEPAFAQGVLSSLVGSIRRSANGSLVVLLLPDCFRIQGPGVAEVVQLAHAPDYDDVRIDRTIDEFNRLAQGVRATGARCVVTDVTRLAMRNQNVWLGSEPVSVLYRRSSEFPSGPVDTHCINDIRLRPVCTDKLSCNRLLRERLPHLALPHTVPFTFGGATTEFLAAQAAEGRSVVLKPRYGSASRAVDRLPADQALAELDDGTSPRVDGDFVCQEWVEAGVVRQKGRDYLADVRLFLVEGDPVGALGRRAAAPVNYAWTGSPLSWMTTTGPTIPVVKRGAGDGADAFTLTARAVESLAEVGRAVVRTIDEAISEMHFDSAMSSRRSFASLEAISGQVGLIELEARSRTSSPT